MVLKSESALGVARARFVEGLSRKATEMRGVIALLIGTPAATRPRDDLRRRLQALHASAQVFRLSALAQGLRNGIAVIDSARDAGLALTETDLRMLSQLIEDAPTLAQRVDEGSGAQPSITPQASKRISQFAPATGRSDTVGVLVVDDENAAIALAALLPPERFDVVLASDPDEGLRAARYAAPDLLLVSARIALRGEGEWVERLRADAMVDVVPLVLISEPGEPVPDAVFASMAVDAVVVKPVSAADVSALVERLVPASGSFAEPLRGEVTVGEVADRLAGEIRRGLLDSTVTGKDERVTLGEGSELLAATWATIARVRSELQERSLGKVRFRDEGRLGGPRFLGSADGDSTTNEVSLVGRRIVVADDDPAVVWFFAGLLREAGAKVTETASGAEALVAARKRRPDLIISDILMPGLDGLALCRALKRDPGLSAVPVILLSWKEDFLVRMRELQSGAVGYLRKESQAEAILTQVRDALRPRVRLEARLGGSGDVSGRVEAVGMLPLLEATSLVRPNSQLVVRDAFGLFEVAVRDGKPVDVSRTSSDGGFVRGNRALAGLIGVSSGRYTVSDAAAAVRHTLADEPEKELAEVVRSIGATVDAVDPESSLRVARIRFDEMMLSGLLPQMPTDVRAAVQRIAQGGDVQAILEVAGRSQILDALSMLARRGVVLAVRDELGNDAVLAALKAREELASMRSSYPPPRPSLMPRGALEELSEPLSSEFLERGSLPAQAGLPRDYGNWMQQSPLVDAPFARPRARTTDLPPSALLGIETADVAPAPASERLSNAVSTSQSPPSLALKSQGNDPQINVHSPTNPPPPFAPAVLERSPSLVGDLPEARGHGSIRPPLLSAAPSVDVAVLLDRIGTNVNREDLLRSPTNPPPAFLAPVSSPVVSDAGVPPVGTRSPSKTLVQDFRAPASAATPTPVTPPREPSGSFTTAEPTPILPRVPTGQSEESPRIAQPASPPGRMWLWAAWLLVVALAVFFAWPWVKERLAREAPATPPATLAHGPSPVAMQRDVLVAQQESPSAEPETQIGTYAIVDLLGSEGPVAANEGHLVVDVSLATAQIWPRGNADEPRMLGTTPVSATLPVGTYGVLLRFPTDERTVYVEVVAGKRTIVRPFH